ncbi:hypothetical protein FQN54_008427 [Arachnomyces sp. PD_36]|nr:hypothetical protein FQN54_008427 [Arachnomyces sp. PD_36]
MPRKEFLRDLQEASGLGQHHEACPRIVDIRAGDDDGAIAFTYVPETASHQPVEFQALVSDISSYPRHHSYFVYTTSDNAPPAVTAYIDRIASSLEGLTISDLLTQVSETLHQALSSEDDVESLFDASSEVDMEDDFDFADNANEDEDDWGAKTISQDSPRKDQGISEFTATGDYSTLRAKLSEDLQRVKLAGFKAGYLGNLGGQILVCVSCRIAKLGISEEAMQAWGLNPLQYLVFILRYQKEYRSLDQVLQDDSAGTKTNIDMHLALCDSYKPSYGAALNVFQGASAFNLKPTEPQPDQQPDKHSLTSSFISKPLNTLLNERFIKILRYRFAHGIGWSAAERFYNDVQGKQHDPFEQMGQPTVSEMEDAPTTSFPDLVTADHAREIVLPAEGSFPLIGMQFALRHFVRCTEFCLVCHCKIDADFEALKPYVCSKSLCLFQYMALGFGPSLEWEIMSQPYVVDLLVSFTYSSAKTCRLQDFPTGLGILVPSVASQGPYPNLNAFTASPQEQPESDPGRSAHLNLSKMDLLFPKDVHICPLNVGDWIRVTRLKRGDELHCRVLDTSYWPLVKLTEPIHVSNNIGALAPRKTETDAPEDVKVFIYDRNFDDLSQNAKCSTLVALLDTLPDVFQMKEYLEKQHSAEASLTKWRDRISRHALDILRWIVASNRSCIMQDDHPITGNLTNKSTANNSTPVSETRVSGMDGYMQFRLAQGAPDKEQRFVNAVTEATNRLNLKHPTIFAWHGSSLSNWHGILREGLHFREVLHGRAFGHGVYMSSHFHVSLSYMGNGYTGETIWPQSKLKITSAISLNEVVNSPSEFVSNSPHLVVAKLDWIQARYLFVQCKSPPEASGSQHATATPSVFYQQDPTYTAQGPNRKPIVIPITAVSQRRRQENLKGFVNKAKGAIGKMIGSAKGEEGDVSDATDDEDLAILGPVSGDVEGLHVDRKSKASPPSPPKTDFVPGSLVGSTLPLLAQPSYATTGATRALQRDLTTTLNIQEKQPLHELGWYIDPNLVNTVYQWIVELHSFDPDLPLAADLKAAGLKSVVMELRFSKDYPMSPPFARIIRPRFLSFMQGGGGHVTAGGALCMELLTNSGWSAVSSIESVLLQIRLALSSTEPKPARLEPGSGKSAREYGVGEAVDAFIRACRVHNWEVPREFSQMGMLDLARADV